ncbi:hypothetical protein HOLleu_22729 [Holothuria leucospilota]|uniref:Uncharacterized protein n=1 Tax=Holothuria leucospilota TaxID=206669 RepID=A0A9Q1BZL7_HOLLE|nr:hypothetical protein HOLleu_22729 [Holothuria leucospilota]
MSKLQKRMWENKHLALNTKMKFYLACVLSTIIYGSETWTKYAKQDTKLNAFHMSSLCKILSITWEDKVTNSEVLNNTIKKFCKFTEIFYSNFMFLLFHIGILLFS